MAGGWKDDDGEDQSSGKLFRGEIHAAMQIPGVGHSCGVGYASGRMPVFGLIRGLQVARIEADRTCIHRRRYFIRSGKIDHRGRKGWLVENKKRIKTTKEMFECGGEFNNKNAKTILLLLL